jgi:hypothetical protein
VPINPELALQTSRRIETGLDRERQPEKLVSVERRAKFVNPPPMTAPGYFQDRQVETGLVADFLRTPELRVMTVVGRGGVGKTAIVCRLLKALEAGRLPDEPGELSVDGIVYLTPVGAHPVSFPNVFADLCRLLPDPDAGAPRAAVPGSAGDPGGADAGAAGGVPGRAVRAAAGQL